MKLLKKVNEDAAGGTVGGGDVAAFAMPMFASLVKRNMPTTPKIIKYGRTKKQKRAKTLGLGEAFHDLMEFDPNSGANPSPDEQNTGTGNFDTSEVISKLKSLETKEKTDNRDTTVFGLEDDNGGTVRVTVKNEQAAEFEKALQNFMSDIDDDEDVPEIAEMLFKLKDHFDIVDIEWPDISEDEEQEQGVEGAPGAGGDDMGAPGAEGGLPGAGGDDMGAPGAEGGEDLLAGAGPAPGGDTGQVTDLLTQVIDMMKADAEARKAEAKAREVEAATKQVSAKVKQEEQMLDMEAYNKSKKEEDKETKRLASLARWKHEMGGSDSQDETESTRGSAPVGREEEETHRAAPIPQQQAVIKAAEPTAAGRVHPHDIASFILKRIK